MAVGGASLRKCIAVYFPRWLLSSVSTNRISSTLISTAPLCPLLGRTSMNAPIFKPSSTGHFSLLKKNAFSGHPPVNLVHVHSHYVIASDRKSTRLNSSH